MTTLISGGLGHENKEIVGNMVMMVNCILPLIGEERQSQTMLSWRPCTSRYLSLKTIPVCKFVYFWFKQIAIVNNVRNKSSSSKYGGEAGKLAILAFPCNQFGAQEPGTCEIIFLETL